MAIIERLEDRTMLSAPTATDDLLSTSLDMALTITISSDLLSNDLDNGAGLQFDSLDTTATFGTLVENLDGTLTYTPGTGYFGQDFFDYTVTDSGGGSPDTATVMIDVIQTAFPPTATDDLLSTSLDMALTITISSDLLGNDLDNGAGLQFDSLDTTATLGTLVDNLDGTLTYTPGTGYFGQDFFDYTVTDSGGGSPDTATVMIDVIQTTAGIPVVSITAGQPDIAEDDSGTAVFNLHRDGGDINLQLDVTYVVLTGAGTATPGSDYVGLPLLVTFFPTITDVTISIDPIDDFLIEGNETVDIVLDDPAEYDPDPAMGNATIIILDDDTGPPVFDSSSYSLAIDELAVDGDIVAALSATDPDTPDFDLTYSFLGFAPDDGMIPESIFEFDSSTPGRIIVNGDGEIALDYEKIATYSLSAEVRDPEGNTGFASVTITVNDENETPSIDFVTPIGSSTLLSESWDVHLKELAQFSGDVWDPDIGDLIDVTFKWGDGTIDSQTGLSSGSDYTFSHTYGALGTYSAVLTVEDSDGAQDTFSFDATVYNTAPEARDDQSFGLDGSTSVGGSVLSNDLDPDLPDSLSAVLVSLPASGTLQDGSGAVLSIGDSFDGTFAYIPNPAHPGQDSFDYQASDGTALSPTATATIIIDDHY